MDRDLGQGVAQAFAGLVDAQAGDGHRVAAREATLDGTSSLSLVVLHRPPAHFLGKTGLRRPMGAGPAPMTPSAAR